MKAKEFKFLIKITIKMHMEYQSTTLNNPYSELLEESKKKSNKES